jgi:dUTP pyrophosphatase
MATATVAMKAAKFLVKRLHPKAKLPTVEHPGEDLGYDVYALKDTLLWKDQVVRIPTGIAVELQGYGFILRDRSSLALQGLTVSGGVIDAGYHGEIFVNMTYRGAESASDPVKILAGQKIAQLIPVLPQTLFETEWTKDLSASSRGEAGYGSTGR